jgi:co-chaperonin GroES (HSP10)
LTKYWTAAEAVTKGGIMLPEKSQGKVLQATVVIVGSGLEERVVRVNQLE